MSRTLRSAVVAFLLLYSTVSFAATITVTNTNDSGAGSLRDAIANAQSGDTINFGLTYPATITLGSTLNISTSLTISGPGAASLAVNGNNSVQVMAVEAGITVNISGVTIENGYALGGAGIVNWGTLNIDRSTFSGNVAYINPYTRPGGGAIENNSGTLTLTNSIITGNSSYRWGGGIQQNATAFIVNSVITNNSSYDSGGIFNSGTLSITDSTISGNSAGCGGGGGMSNQEGGVVTITNSTFASNTSCDVGGGLLNGNGVVSISFSTFSGNSSARTGGGIASGGPTLVLKNTIVANTPSGGNCLIGGGIATSQGHDLSDDSSCATFFTQIGDVNNVQAGLDPNGLQNNGGPTQTIALLRTSPAVDAIPTSPTNYCTDISGNPVATDQRGTARPQGAGCDIGAFELVQYTAEIQPPISSDGSSVFKANRAVIPVKFTLSLGGNSTCNLPPATISLTETSGANPGPVNSSEYITAADNGSNFRIGSTGCQYVYNLGTSGLGTGRYLVQISIGNSPVGIAPFGLN